MGLGNSIESARGSETFAALENSISYVDLIKSRLGSGEKITVDSAFQDVVADLSEKLSALEDRDNNTEEEKKIKSSLDEYLELLNGDPDLAKLYLEDIGCEGPNRLGEQIEKQTEALKNTLFFTDKSFGCQEAIKSFLDRKDLKPADRLRLLNSYVKGAEEIDGVTSDIDYEFFQDFAEELFAPANALFAKSIESGSDDFSAALKLAEKAADHLRAERSKVLDSANYLGQNETVLNAVYHLFDIEDDPGVIDIDKVWRMLESSNHLGIKIDPRLKSYFEKNYLKSFTDRVKNQYRTKLEINKSLVDSTYASILHSTDSQQFATKAEYDAYVKSQMKSELADFYVNKPKLLPDSVWEGKRTQRINEANRHWEARVDKGEQHVWRELEQTLDKANSQKFSNKAAYIEHLKQTTQQLSEAKHIPDEVWDNRVKDRFKDRVENRWQHRLEKGSESAWNKLNQAFKEADQRKFNSKEELVSFIQLTTAKLDNDKTVPDDFWDKNMKPAVSARVDVAWARRSAEKKKDSERVQSALQKVSLAPNKITGQPKTEQDFFRIAKLQIPDGVKGKLTDSEWDQHMQAYFYPTVKAQLKQNEGVVSAAMKGFAKPSTEDFLKVGSQNGYLQLVKQRFAIQNKGVMGLIPNVQYDALRDRVLLTQAREQWRTHEASEANALNTAKAALNSENLLGTVHHFAKHKKIAKPTVADIKASSSKALASQFNLRPDQLKLLDTDLKLYAAQTLGLHQSRQRSAMQTVKQYRVPPNTTFTADQLKTSASFYEAMVTVAGFMNFTHVDDWYLVEPEAMAHIESLHQEQLTVIGDQRVESSEAVEEEIEVSLEEGSEELAKNQKENINEVPLEATDWMIQCGVSPESVGQKGVDRFGQIMRLPEFTLGGIPKSDLKILIPALINLAGGFREQTWNRFRLQVRDDLRATGKDPQSRLFQILKTFTMGYPYKPNDFDLVPGINQTFNNLVRRIKSPDGEKFSTIKHLYLNFLRPEQLEELDISEAELTDLIQAEIDLDTTEEAVEEIMIDEVLEEVEPETTIEPVVVEEVAPEDEVPALEELEEEVEPESEITPVEIEEIEEIEDSEDLEPVVELEEVLVEDPEDIVPVEVVPEVEEVVEPEMSLETITEPETGSGFETFSDYLAEGAKVLQEVDSILRPKVEERDEESKQRTEIGSQPEENREELRLEERKSPLDEAAEVVPDKLHKHLTKMRASGLLSDEALSWLFNQGTEFYVADGQHLTLAAVLGIINVSLQARGIFNLKNKLSSGVLARPVGNAELLIEKILRASNQVDQLTGMVVGNSKEGRIQGHWETKLGLRPFTFSCKLGVQNLVP